MTECHDIFIYQSVKMEMEKERNHLLSNELQLFFSSDLSRMRISLNKLLYLLRTGKYIKLRKTEKCSKVVCIISKSL